MSSLSLTTLVGACLCAVTGIAAILSVGLIGWAFAAVEASLVFVSISSK